MQNYKKSKRVVTSPAFFYNQIFSFMKSAALLVDDYLLCFLIEDMYLIQIHSNLDGIARSCSCTRIYLCSKVSIIDIEVQKNLRT